MLFKLIRNGEKNAFKPYVERAASELNLTEKTLETWIATNPVSVTMVYPPPGRLIYQGNSPT